MEKDIENLIEQLTKVRPEMLNEEALKLFNTIMAILDDRDRLIKENKELKATHIMTHNKTSIEEKAKLFDVIDNSVDTFLDKIETKKEQGCELLKCKIIDKNIKLNKQLIDLKHNSVPKSKIKEKIEEYLEYDKENKSYTSKGEECYTMEYFKAIALQELIED